MIAFLRGFALAGLMAFGFALGIAWEHRGDTPMTWLTGHSLKAQRDALRAEIEAPLTGWSARLDTCHESNAELTGGLKEQKDAVKAMKDQSAAMVARSVQGVSRATAAAERAVAVAAEIAGRAPASDDKCAAAYQLVRDYAPQ